MSGKTEKFFKDINKFLDENSDNLGDDAEQLNILLNNYMSQRQPFAEVTEENASSSDDFLELAQSASSKSAALKYAKKALELDPDNIDAAVMTADLTASSIEKLLEKYKKLIGKAEEKLEAEGYFEENCVGEFWLIIETRPYMRLLYEYSDNLVTCGKMRLAAAEYEKMLRLCEGDNLGARYRLMHIYAFLEDEQSALGLLKKYPDDDTQFLLPLSVLYYKLGNLRESNKYLKKLCEINKDTRKFFNGVIKGNLKQYLKNASPYGYRPFTIEEFAAEAVENSFLFACTSAYFDWAWQKLNSKR